MNLQQWHNQGRYFDVDGNAIFYQMAGSGVPLLLIHGYPTASWDFIKLWSPLCERFQCITLDMLGFGYSDKPQQNYSIFSQADVYCRLLEKLNIKQCHIISHDYGDTVAQELLARQNEGSLNVEILSLNLLNGGLFAESHRPVFTQKLLLSPLGALMVRLMNRNTLAKNLRTIFGAQTQPSEQQIDEFWQLITANNGRQVMHRLIVYIKEREQNRERWVGCLQQTSIPLRFICGLVDPISGAHMAQRYRQLVPNADVVELQDIGHYPQLEAPDAVLRSVLVVIDPGYGIN